MPKSIRINKIVRYGLIGLIVLLLLGLGWWYLFLRNQNNDLRALDSARGADIEASTFQNSAGSTYGNLVTSLGVSSAGLARDISTATPSSGSSVGNTFGSLVASLPQLAAAQHDTAPVNSAVPRLWQVTKTPVAGASFRIRAPLEFGSASSTVVRFVERGTGYILEADTETGDLVRITNTLIPRVYEALIAKDVVILRSVDDAGNIVTAAGVATSTPLGNEPTTLPLISLPQNIRSMALDDEGKNIAFITPTANGASVTRAKWNGENAETIASVGVTGWGLQWLPNRIVLVQYPASGAPSYAYEIKSGGMLSPILRNVENLALLPRANSAALLYSSGFSLSLRTNATTSIITLPLKTTSEKCVWAPGTAQVAYCAGPQIVPSFSLNDWLQGAVHTSDAWWKIEASTGYVSLVYTPDSSSWLDVENPVIDAAGNYISFMNSLDKSLWLLRIKE